MKWNNKFRLLENHPLFHQIVTERPQEEFVELNQVHGTEVIAIEGVLNDPLSGDALCTQKKGITLAVRHADCQAAILYDPRTHAVALIHAGWRGLIKEIYPKTIEKMVEFYGSKREELILCIGPSLGPESAEFINYRTELPSSVWKYQIKTNFFDLWTIAVDQAVTAGLLREHIEIVKIDTKTTPPFHSHRRDKTLSRNYTLAKL